MTGIAAAPDADLFDVELPLAPYPGLRPFERHEWPIFFGREPMTHAVITRLLEQNLVVVHGDSGCGKSSLIRAGVLIHLEQQHSRGGHDWRTCIMLPREAPLWGLAQALAGLRESEPAHDFVREIRRALNAGRGAAGKLEELLCARSVDRVCILVDQFEELFRFANETSADEARLLVEVLVGLLEKADERRSPESDLPPLRIFAILTMRSEFLGVCARFKGLAEAVNRTQYLLPQMERPALMRAIREPALLYDGEVSRELAERLIGDAGGGQDQLPLIQHGLMLLWRRKAGPPSAGPPAGYGGFAEAGEPFHHDNVLSDASVPFRHATGPEEPVARPGHQGDDFIPPPSYRYEGGPAWRLDLEDYRGGSLVALLSDHADQVIAAAAPDARREKIVEHLFRALTDINAEGNAVRRPQSLARLVAVTGSDEETLRDIIGRFRADGISFLTPYGDAPIALDTLIDISHEALIRCWRKIADEKDGWLHKELRDGLIWKTLRVQAQKGETLSSAATADRDAWLRTLPSSGWSERYDGGWAEVQGLLDASRKARDAEARSRQELEEARRREAEERTRRAEEAEHAVARLAEAQQRVANEQRQRAEAERQRAAEAEERASEADAGRRRSKQMAVVAGVFGLVALCAALAAASMWWQASRAEARAQLGDSLYRAVQARNQLKDARPVTAMQLALAGLPEGTATPSARPWVGETGGALVEAMSLQRELSVLRGHEDWVLEAAFSPDGTRIVSGSDDNTVRVWDAASGAEQLVLRGHEGPVWAASFSPEGTRIVSGSEDATLRVRDAASGAEGLVLRGHEGPVWATEFSPDGARIVSGSADNTVRMWDATSGVEQLVLRGHERAIFAARFSPDGTRIVSGSDDTTLRVWDAASGAEKLVLGGHEGPVWAAGFSPDGARIVSGSLDNTVRVWDAASGVEQLVLRGHEDWLRAVGFSPDGARIVSGSDDTTLRIWDAASGAEQLVLRGHHGPVWAAEFSPDGARIVSGSFDNTVRLWKTASEAELLVLRGHEGAVLKVGFSPDGTRVVSGSSDSTARVWNAASAVEQLVLRGHEGFIWAAEFSPDGARVVSGSFDNTVRVWSAASGAEELVLRGHEGFVFAAGLSPDGTRIVSGSDDTTVRLWDAASGAEQLVLRGHEEAVFAAGFSPDGARIVSGSDDTTLRVWDAASGAEELVLRGHEGPVWAAEFSPDGARIGSGSADNTVRVWDAASGAELLVLRGHEGIVFAAGFSPDGARIVSGSSDSTTRVWDAASGAEQLVLRGHERAVLAAGFSPDGARIVSGSQDRTVRVTWVPRSKQELIETARARLPRELTEEEKRRFYLTTD